MLAIAMRNLLPGEPAGSSWKPRRGAAIFLANQKSIMATTVDIDDTSDKNLLGSARNQTPK